MTERGHVFRRAFSWLPAQFAWQSDAPVGAPRQFGSTEHLAIEAIAAFVDGELRMNAHLRAAHHISLCPECAAEVEGHRRARAALRDSHPIRIPSALLGLLSQILHCPPEDDAGAWQHGQCDSPHAHGTADPPRHSGPPPERQPRPADRFVDGSPREHPEPR
ncbi:MAG: anti-sigma E factor RseA [Mycobacterium sp.]